MSWESASCEQEVPARLTLGSATPSDAFDRYHLRTISGDEPNQERFVGVGATQSAGESCHLLASGRVRHSSWVLLTTEGDAVEVELVVVGRAGHPPVRIERATVEARRVEQLRGGEFHRANHVERLPADPPDPLPVYLLALGVPLPAGVDAPGFEIDVEGLVERAACGICATLQIDVRIVPAASGPPPGGIRANVVVYELSVP